MSGSLLADPTLAFGSQAPRRVVSLVPSITASLHDLGLSGALAGVTDYCPREAGLEHIPSVGGPKNPDVERVRALRPDLVLANREENGRAAVEALAAAGLAVWVAFPQTVREAIQDLWTLANLFRSGQAMRQVDLLEKSVEWAERAAAERPARCFCPIWEAGAAEGTAEDPGPRWRMTFNRHTYPHDVLRICGGENVFAERERRYPLEADLGRSVTAENPGERDTRYPRVLREEILAAQPEVILLPSEPYLYGEAHAAALMQELRDTPAAKAGRIFCLDGTLLMWHGTRLARALEELPPLLNLSSLTG